MRQRLRRIGSASAAVSAGALVLVLAAPAADAAAAETCKKGVDPESTIENWKCNLGNLREALTPKSPTPTPTPTPKKTSANKTKKTTKSTPGKAPATAPRSPSVGGGGAAAPSGPAPMSDVKGLKPYSGEAPSAGLPGVLPTPEIAADPNAYRNPSGGTAAMPQTRLISPVAAGGRDDGQLLLVAAAAGAAGAVGALNLSVAGRAFRRRRAR
ncbi:hypothetical protein [Actinomadura latina]|uniref:Uncharacterized protein n=1 Tax=Actinomadura latina TaxID=163603 RepID=A0A846ZBV2_9ACTN|nr:hypothetical protein [Actinomadura latina]NKZ09187.1 hypothetical protein [Actinomadura latina]